MKYILLLSMLWICSCKAQIIDSFSWGTTTNGFIYSKGITWTENKNQDSVLEIIIEGDTMTAIRNLLLYCLQEKKQSDYSGYVLSTLNLDNLSKLIKNEDFDFYLKQYRNVISGNNLKRGIKPKKKK